jgi:hypothetical protein
VGEGPVTRVPRDVLGQSLVHIAPPPWKNRENIGLTAPRNVHSSLQLLLQFWVVWGFCGAADGTQGLHVARQALSHSGHTPILSFILCSLR